MFYKSLNGIQRGKHWPLDDNANEYTAPVSINSRVHLPPGDFTIRGQSKPEASFPASLASQQLANRGSRKQAEPFLKFARLA